MKIGSNLGVGFLIFDTSGSGEMYEKLGALEVL